MTFSTGRSNKKRCSRSRFCSPFESLESRQLLAADVGAFSPLGEIGAGGRIDSISVQPGDSERILIGGDLLGVGLTTDGGRSWSGDYVGFENYHISDFTWDPNNPGHVWVGTLGGPHFSSDYGETWEARRDGLPAQLAGNFSAPVEKVLVDPVNPSRLLAVEGDHRDILVNRANFTYSGNIRISIDGGQTWDAALTSNIGSNVNIVDAQFANDTRVVLAAHDDAVYVSELSGAAGTWVRKPFAVPEITGAPQITSIAVHPSDADTIWATVLDVGVLRSDDGGESWDVVGARTLPSESKAGYYTVEPAVNSDGSITMYLGNASNNGGNGIFRSNDLGDSWTRIAGNDDEFGDPNQVVNGEMFAAGIGAYWLEVDPNDSSTVWSGTSSRVIRSSDGGDNWIDMLNDIGTVEGTYQGRGYTGWVARNAEFNPFDPGEIVLQGLDSAKLLISQDGGDTWRRERDGLTTPYRGGHDIVYFSDSIAYGAFGQWGADQVIGRTTDGGQTWTELASTGVSFGLPNNKTAGEFRAVHVDANDDSRVWALATSGVFYTTNADTPSSTMWQKLDLPGSPLNMVADPFDNDGFYVMTSEGMYHTFDGQNFDFLTGSPTHTSGNRRFVGLEADPNNDGVVYLANEDSSSGSSNGLWRFEGQLRNSASEAPISYSSADWTQLGLDSWGTSSNKWIRAVAVDPTNSDRIVVGSNKDPFADLIDATGVWFSEDGGESFRQINDGLGMLRINSATFSPDGSQIVVGTGGRGWYTASVTDENTDTTPPTAFINVGADLESVTIGFSESVIGFELDDLTLTRNGQNIDISAATLQGAGENSVFTLRGLNDIITESGTYRLSLDADAAGITDSAGNALANDAVDSFFVNNSAPRVTIGGVSSGAQVDAIDIFFTESVIGFDVGDLDLTRDGSSVDLSGASLQGMGENSIFRLSGLQDVLEAAGDYRLELDASESGIRDSSGNALSNDDAESFTLVGRSYDFDRRNRESAIIQHEPDMVLDSGSIELSFNADRTGGTLLSKDAAGQSDGDLRISYIRVNGTRRVRVWFDSKGRTYRLTSHRLQDGVEYNVRLTFGERGLRLYINGVLMGKRNGIRTGLSNSQAIVLGASAHQSARETTDRLRNFFDGRISGLTIRDGDDELVFGDFVTL